MPDNVVTVPIGPFDTDRLNAFFAQVGKPDRNGCRLWRGARKPSGSVTYGVFSFDGVTRLAHRCGFAISNGEPVPGLLICHSCDVGLCVEASHLVAGTINFNNQDRERKGRGRRAFGLENGRYTMPERTARGERHGCARLTAEGARLIRERRLAGVSIKKIAADSGVSYSTVQKIALGELWKA